MGVQIISLRPLFSILWGIHPEVELLDHMLVLFLIFRGTAVLFSTLARLFYVPTNSAPGFPFFLHSLPNTCYFLFCFVLFFDSSHPNGCEAPACFLSLPSTVKYCH